MNTTRRKFFKAAGGLAASTTLPLLPGLSHATIAFNPDPAIASLTSDPALWSKVWARRFTNVLPNPLAAASIYKPSSGSNVYSIQVDQGSADLLGVPGVTTPIWGYHNQETGPTFPGRSFEVRSGNAITVNWTNGLASAAGQPLPHLLPVDQTIAIKAPTTGVPLAVHHHGGDTAQEFDGGPDQWSTPLRKQTGPGIKAATFNPQSPQAVSYVYENKQEASLHWYHDHAESITGLNVAAGLAGLYVVRDHNEATLQKDLLLPAAQHEVALVLQDRTFDAKGRMTYASKKADSPTPLPSTFPSSSPSHQPEVFGDVMLVNGKAWPTLTVSPRPWRFRVLNGSDSRFYQLKLSSKLVPMFVYGTDQGFLNRPVKVGADGLLIAPGERYDIVIDFFAALWSGSVIELLNSAATPFPGGDAPSAAMSKVMRFKVDLSSAAFLGTRSLASTLTPLRGNNGTSTLPNAPSASANAPVRRVLLGEGSDEYGRITPMLGTYDPTGAHNTGTLSFADPATESPTVGATEVWEFWNTTEDAHPIHMHLVKFQIQNRQAFTGTIVDTAMPNGWTGVRLQPGAKLGAVKAPAATEAGWKDTVICPPGFVTRVVVNFNRRGKYVYHCHLLSHEDHDMMRWYNVV